jgi:hypothetical protein
MQLATAGCHDAQHFAGGRALMNAIFVTYLLAMLMAFIVIVILESNDDGGAA